MKNSRINSNNFGAILLSILYPIGGLIYSIRSFRAPIAKYCFIIFCAFYGSTMIYNNEGTLFGEGADIQRYAMTFIAAHENSDVHIDHFFKNLDDHDKLDFYNPILVYSLSRLTGNPHIYFMVVGLIFGFFYANNIWNLISNINAKFVWINTIFLIVFALQCSFDTMSTIRMHTGFQVFFFGIFSYLTHNNKKRLIWIPLAVLIHFSLFYLAALTILFFLVKKADTRILFAFFIIAHVINELNLDVINRLFSFMPADVEERLNLYSSEEKIEMLKQSGKFFLGHSNIWARIDSILVRFTILTLTTYLFLPKNTYLRKITELKSLLNFSLLLYAFSLLIANLPSGYRFMTISGMVFFAYFSILFTNHYKSLKHPFIRLLTLLNPFLIIICIKSFRNILDFTTFFIFIGNFITSFFVEVNISVIESIKRLF